MSFSRNVRRAQLIGPAGPGAIIDLIGESFVAVDVSRWSRTLPVSMPRLTQRLGVRQLKTPTGFGVPYRRFPEWLFCGRCRRMIRRRPRDESAKLTCAVCAGDRPLIPMRFIAICSNGHMADIDWWYWAHTNSTTKCEVRGKLRFDHRPEEGSGLSSLVVRCAECGAGRSLDRITSRGSLTQRCEGLQPWQQPLDAEACDTLMVATQRGASNVYFPSVVSALDLPPESDWDASSATLARLRDNHLFLALVEDPTLPVRDMTLKFLASREGLTVPELERLLSTESSAQAHTGTEEDILPEEWVALLHPRDTEFDPRDNFITRPSRAPRGPGGGTVETELLSSLRQVILVDRLREVRVLKGFHRYTRENMVSANLAPDQTSLPAIEVFGEGFLLAFEESAITEWERLRDVRERCRTIERRVEAADAYWLPPVTPRFLLLHTLAHLLLRATAFEAGYPTSSLGERIYTTHPEQGPAMAGVLIYTAAGDSEGTLGGLVRMGEPERLPALLHSALVDGQWCSLDPVCSESPAQGPGGLSMAACHACALVPETSCQATNRLLDRRLLIDPEFGFFRNALTIAEDVPWRARW
ncbi:hypothetical protein Afil01_02050 [Actinorhabdospora filicis]|uniref:MrfA-like Zn-binding domain-containing protein n=1 Tax=Actinorhabdospora filicis TaxID=1785913 RepID=A0A9W6W6Y2_9ACTN|nr:DUF1998 domain-containing protein [Actinorhabdospora filicis]GLZ75398.1 hypothetical protein Afil01_02050 [Actinorhabdospora filicis]